MSKPQTRNRDYGYQPNMSEGVVDMESRVTTSGMGMAGKVEKHSEFMQPNNQSYDDMEYLYPGSDYPWDNNPAMNPIGPGRGWPGNPTDCKSLWNKLFPKHPIGSGSFIPDAQDFAALKQYVRAGCPTIYIPNFCCPGVKISGPKKVDSEGTAQYSITGEKGNCYYDWDSSAGRIVGGTFEAPKGPTTVKISVHPFMGDDNEVMCDTISVQITTDGCAGETIGVTSTQMNVGESQTLTIVGEVPGKAYTWAIASGGGTMSGSTYTAPASNPGCTSNPVIQLKVGASVCASVSIAVNGAGSSYTAAHQDWTSCTCQVVGGNAEYGAGSTNWDCAGISSSTSPSASLTYSPPCDTNWWCADKTPGAVTDVRTAEALAAGCCPSKLL